MVFASFEKKLAIEKSNIQQKMLKENDTQKNKTKNAYLCK